MDLVNRYVQAVRRHLPAALQEDIASELTEDILSELKDKEAALGRPLDEAEEESVSIVIVTAILISPRCSRLAKLRRVLVNLATIGTASLLLKAGDLLIAVDQRPNLVDIVKGINGGITLALLLVSIGTAIQTVSEIVRLMQTNRA
jgi:hypothetical protein